MWNLPLKSLYGNKQDIVSIDSIQIYEIRCLESHAILMCAHYSESGWNVTPKSWLLWGKEFSFRFAAVNVFMKVQSTDFTFVWQTVEIKRCNLRSVNLLTVKVNANINNRIGAIYLKMSSFCCKRLIHNHWWLHKIWTKSFRLAAHRHHCHFNCMFTDMIESCESNYVQCGL